MASGHMNRVKRPDTWLHRPMLQNVKKALANPEPSTHDPERPCGLCAACRVLPYAPWHRIIVLAAAPARIVSLGVPIGLEKGAEAVVDPAVAARNGVIIRRQARHKAALGLVVQHRDKLGAIIGLAAQRLVRDDDRGGNAVGAMRPSTSCGMVMRSSASLASSPLSIVTAVQRRPASLRATAVNTCVPIGFSGSRIVTGTSMAASNTSPPSGHCLCVLRRT